MARTFSTQKPGTFVRVGVRDPEWQADRSLHTPTFDLHEDALAIGAALLAESARRWLREYRLGAWADHNGGSLHES